MTPQIQAAQRAPVDAKSGASEGGDRGVHSTVGRAQRVRVIPAWKVKDIVLPEPDKSNHVAERQSVKKERISDGERQVTIHWGIHRQDTHATYTRRSWRVENQRFIRHPVCLFPALVRPRSHLRFAQTSIPPE